MTETAGIDTKVSAEGRVVIPAAVREALGVQSGDRVRFIVDDGHVRLVSAQSLLSAVWANNPGSQAGDSVGAVREARDADRRRVTDRWDRLDVAGHDTRSEGDIEGGILAGLGLAR